MLNFLYYAKQNIKHYTQLVAETQEQMQQIKGAEGFEAEAEWMKDCSNFVESMDYHDWNVIDVRIRPNGEHDFEMVCKKCGERAILRPQAGEIAFNQQQSLNKYPRFPYFIKLNRAKSFEAEA